MTDLATSTPSVSHAKLLLARMNISGAGSGTFTFRYLGIITESFPLRDVEAIHFGARGPDACTDTTHSPPCILGYGKGQMTQYFNIASPSCFLEMHPLSALPSVDAVTRLNPNLKRWKIVSRKVCLATNLWIDLFAHVTVHEHSHMVKY